MIPDETNDSPRRFWRRIYRPEQANWEKQDGAIHEREDWLDICFSNQSVGGLSVSGDGLLSKEQATNLRDDINRYLAFQEESFAVK